MTFREQAITQLKKFESGASTVVTIAVIGSAIVYALLAIAVAVEALHRE